MRWQKDYLDILIDPMFNTRVFMAIREANYLHGKPELNDFIGPHNNREMNLMIAGRKPLTLLDEFDSTFWMDAVEKHNFIFEVFTPHDPRLHHRDQPEKQVIIALPGQEWRVERVKRHFQDILKSGNTDRDMARLGYLLGYKKECIKAFLVRKAAISKLKPMVVTIPKDPLIELADSLGWSSLLTSTMDQPESPDKSIG